MELLVEIWRRAISVQPPLSPQLMVLTAVAALVLVLAPRPWRLTRLLVTITHEGAHALVASLAGRRLRGIRLHSDTSGLTVSSGRPSGPGMVATLAAGYLGPAAVGLGAAALLVAGHSVGLLWSIVVLLTLMLLKIRNFYGLLVLGAAGLLLVAVSWYLPASSHSGIAALLTWVLLLAAPKPVLELAREHRRGRGAGSDADQLARLTGVPALMWLATFLVANLAGLVVGGALLVPALGTLLTGLVAAVRP